MAKYMVFYNSSGAMRARNAEMPPEQAAAVMQEWMAWGGRVGDRLIDMGSPLEPADDADAQVSGFSVVDAESPEQLDSLLAGHPHLAAGGTISTHKFQELPSM